VKWVVLLVVVILTAPTILGRLMPESKPRRRWLLYRSAQRYGVVAVFVAVMLATAGLLALVLILRHW
jgi:hypothetical protein